MEGICGEYDEDANNCKECRDRVFTNKPIAGAWSRHQKVELNAHEKDVLQPKNKDGTINKKFVRAYGTKTIEKEYKATKKEIEKITY